MPPIKELIIAKQAEKELNKADKPTRIRIVSAILGLLEEPPQGDIKALQGELRNLYRLRVGKWRVTYAITTKTVEILQITPRGGAYKRGV